MRKELKILLTLACVICSFSACVTNKQTDLLQDIKLKYPQVTFKPEEYRIIPGDQLSVTVYAWDEATSRIFAGYTPQLTYQGRNEATGVSTSDQIRHLENTDYVTPITVYSDGTITFPYIGKVYVQGLTLLQAKKLISQKLGDFAEGTTADVTLSNRYFSILGEAGANRITMPNTSMNIFQALTLAGNIGPYGDRSKVTIIRQNATGTTTKTFDLRSKDIIDTEFYYIQPNDVIYIPQTSNKFLGSTTSFAGIFGLATSLIGVVIVIIRIF
ncbi:polysaccharide biosynthesis/export family protein [Dysgonomonas sp. 511]|uniref:polysaccharide biosynthesis/export family protein n=1 Tax=Dysgonomonas sp. 511 TaxID=2302930 RepID=UPI0013D38D45|nr:polysaccharide biosynthesis/export family protein [Dysgonomonas sp. 511]NDV78181.1 hypothetical protein [Dysgonomonas sp. 511]